MVARPATDGPPLRGFLAFPKSMQLVTEFSWRQPWLMSKGLDHEKLLEEADLLAAQGCESQSKYARDRLPIRVP
jgi:hypothetical protein